MTLEKTLSILEQTGLIRPAPDQAEPAYRFHHVLIQEAVYASLLRTDRRQLHQLVGETLEALYPSEQAEIAARLGQHFVEAGNLAHALDCFERAATLDLAHHALPEAQHHFRQALDLAYALPADLERRIALHIRYGRTLELSNQYQEAHDHYQAMIERGMAQGEPRLELAGLTTLATLYAIPTPFSTPQEAIVLSERALSLAQAIGAREAEARIFWNLTLAYRVQGRHSQAIAFGETSLAIARELELREQVAYTLHDLTVSYEALQEYDKARHASMESRAYWREVGNLSMLVDNLSARNHLFFYAGQYAEALQNSEEAHRLSQINGNVWGQAFSRLWSAIIRAEQGRPDLAIEILETNRQLTIAANLPALQVGNAIEGAWIHAMMGDLESTISNIERAQGLLGDQTSAWNRIMTGAITLAALNAGNLELARSSLQVIGNGNDHIDFFGIGAFLIPQVQAEFALQLGETAKAIELAQQTIGEAQALGMLGFLPMLCRIQGIALLKEGNPAAAYDVLMQGRAAAERIGSQFYLWQLLGALASLADQTAPHGSPPRPPLDAAALRAEARALIREFAAHIPSPSTRTAFLNRADVRALLDQGE